jgi:hypothetical protein
MDSDEDCMQVRFGTKAELLNANRNQVVAIDLGFAGPGRRSCGMAQWGDLGTANNGNHTYADALAFLRAWEEPQLHLIVEAPLFYAFDKHGNPIGRSTVEPSTHYWYLRAGIAVGFAALNLVRELLRSEATYSLCLYEGFLPHLKTHNPHRIDAINLLRAATEPECIRECSHCDVPGEIRTVLGFVGLPEPENLPVVIEVF